MRTKTLAILLFTFSAVLQASFAEGLLGPAFSPQHLFGRGWYRRRQLDRPSTVSPYMASADRKCINDTWNGAAYNLSEFPAIDSFLRGLGALWIYRASGFPESYPVALLAMNATNFDNSTFQNETLAIAGDVMYRALQACVSDSNATNTTLPSDQVDPLGRRIVTRDEAFDHAEMIWLWNASTAEGAEDLGGVSKMKSPLKRESKESKSSRLFPRAEDEDRRFDAAAAEAYRNLQVLPDGSLSTEATNIAMQASSGIFLGILSQLTFAAMTEALVAPMIPIPVAGPALDRIAAAPLEPQTIKRLTDMLLVEPSWLPIGDCAYMWGASPRCSICTPETEGTACREWIAEQLADCRNTSSARLSALDFWGRTAGGATNEIDALRYIWRESLVFQRMVETRTITMPVKSGYRLPTPKSFVTEAVNVATTMPSNPVQDLSEYRSNIYRPGDPFAPAAGRLLEQAGQTAPPAPPKGPESPASGPPGCYEPWLVPGYDEPDRGGPDTREMCNINLGQDEWMAQFNTTWAGLDFAGCFELACGQCRSNAPGYTYWTGHDVWELCGYLVTNHVKRPNREVVFWI